MKFGFCVISFVFNSWLKRVVVTLYMSKQYCLIKSALLNTCPMHNKFPLILELVAEHDLDLIFITETWTMSDEIPLISSLNNFSHLPRRNTHNYGGGIGIIYIHHPFIPST